MFDTNTKLSIVTVVSILLVSFILLVNQRIMREIESMQTTAGKISQEPSQKHAPKTQMNRVTNSFVKSPLRTKIEMVSTPGNSAETIDNRKETTKIIYEMPFDSRILMQ